MKYVTDLHRTVAIHITDIEGFYVCACLSLSLCVCVCGVAKRQLTPSPPIPLPLLIHCLRVSVCLRIPQSVFHFLSSLSHSLGMMRKSCASASVFYEIKKKIEKPPAPAPSR